MEIRLEHVDKTASCASAGRQSAGKTQNQMPPTATMMAGRRRLGGLAPQASAPARSDTDANAFGEVRRHAQPCQCRAVAQHYHRLIINSTVRVFRIRTSPASM